MCGIAGYISQTMVTDPRQHQRLHNASQRMAARGPDDAGIFSDPRVGLAHRRLAIIDRHGGRQPMRDAATGSVIVFNGEIYNYRELRAELQAKGWSFESQSDTEVLLRAYLAWGSACLQRLAGMYAFAVYTPTDGTLFLARDRLGVKPLFWTRQPETVYFASSMRALLDLLPRHPAMNTAAASHYLSTIRVNMGSMTLLEDVQMLEPGHWMRISRDGECTVARYWEPTCPAVGDKPRRSPESAVETLRSLLRHAVSERLISDVPLGGFLSGGLDSTIIAALASELTDHRYHAYSVGYRQPGYNEFTFVDDASTAYGMTCRQLDLQPTDYPALWTFLIQENGLPLSTPNEVPIYMLAKALKQDYTVALSGEGADEVFGGYTIPYFAAYDFERASRLPLDKTAMRAVDLAMLRAYGKNYLPDLADQHLCLNAWLSPAEKALVLHPEIVADLDGDRLVHAFYADLYARHPDASTLDRIMQVHLRVNLEGLLLRVDSSTMAASVEARVPFTDHRLVDFAFSLTDRDRIDWRNPQARQNGASLNVLEIVQQDYLESKRLLRQAYADRVPKSILTRPKMSFPVPVFDWMQDWMKPTMQAAVADSPLRKTLFNPALIDGWLNGQYPVLPMKLWPIVNLCLWHNTL